jgi:uncharacterized protein (UPF0179 family)
MVLVTLVGEQLAKKDKDFIYTGSLSECRDCKLKNVCFNLEDGCRYKITNIRDIHHDCKIHEGGVRIVEVEKIPIPACIESKNAVEGETISINPDCKNIGCDFYKLCSPVGVESGTKLKITKVKGDIKCPENKNLKEVLLE